MNIYSLLRFTNLNFCYFSVSALCLPLSLSDTETVGLVEMTQGLHGKCVNDEPIRGFTECHGSCNSGTKYNRLTMKQDKKCHCCSVASYEELKVPIKCIDGTKKTIPLSVPKTCMCQPCDKIESYKLKNNPNDHLYDFLKTTVVY